MVIPETLSRPDPFEARVAVALTVEKMAPLLAQAQIAPVFDFLVFQEALGDRHSEVRKTLLDAGIAIIDLHGGEAVTLLMKTFEDYLGRSGKSSETEDYIKEAVVIVRQTVSLKQMLITISFSVDSLDISTQTTHAFRRLWID